ncbi:MAG: hypothetical protein ACOY3P_15860 [Planctomycetota bacterium]
MPYSLWVAGVALVIAFASIALADDAPSSHEIAPPNPLPVDAGAPIDGAKPIHVPGDEGGPAVMSGDDATSGDDASPTEPGSSAGAATASDVPATAEATDAASAAAEETTPDAEDAAPSAESIGEPLAPGMIRLIEQEIVTGIRQRGLSDQYARFLSYAAAKLNSSSGRYTGSELTGNCRLSWYDYLLRHPLEAPRQAEQFTRETHAAVLQTDAGLDPLLAIAAPRMDLAKPEARILTPVKSPQAALDEVRRALIASQSAFAAALAPLTKGEVRELQSRLESVFIGQNHVGHTLNDRGTGRRLCDLMEKIDRAQFYVAAQALGGLSRPDVLEQLARLQSKGTASSIDGVTGAVERIDTPAGAILIGGRGQNVYYLDKLTDVAAVIDLGGNDGYADGTTTLQRPVLVVIDLEGNDAYRSQKPGVQGSSTLGISALIERSGDDVYQAMDHAQGSTLAGVGILVDIAGNDRYRAQRRAQGQAIGGFGLLLDREGDDDYRAAMWGQGMAGPLAFALLDDVAGADHYFCGGAWPDSYEETPGLEGWGQGVGAGLRQVANGGIGMILDGGDDDVYEFDYLAHGGGYWCGLGFARDFGGNDQRLITREHFSGGRRTERSFQRFGCGWGCHYSLGFLFDDSGYDVYTGTIMGTGMAWDCSMGVLCDFDGDDRYEATGGLTQGVGAQMGLGVLFDYKGNDTYLGNGQGYAPSSISYHDLPACGGNFSFAIDYGGEDKYGSGARNSSYIQRGASGGFLIDRPREEEAASAPPQPTTRGKK